MFKIIFLLFIIPVFVFGQDGRDIKPETPTPTIDATGGSDGGLPITPVPVIQPSVEVLQAVPTQTLPQSRTTAPEPTVTSLPPPAVTSLPSPTISSGPNAPESDSNSALIYISIAMGAGLIGFLAAIQIKKKKKNKEDRCGSIKELLEQKKKELEEYIRTLPEERFKEFVKGKTLEELNKNEDLKKVLETIEGAKEKYDKLKSAIELLEKKYDLCMLNFSLSKGKQLIVFDLDGTLTESKAEIDGEMASLLAKLLEAQKVAVIGGGKFEQFQLQLLSKLFVPEEFLTNLFLFPVTATTFYKHTNNKWTEIYNQNFSNEEKEEILSALETTFRELNYKHPEKTYGELIEDRGGQITFSILGQEAPTDLKEKWNKTNPNIRLKIEEILQKHLPNMEVKVAGLTSLDITRKGVDKGYGIKQISNYSGVPLKDILFVGDAFSHEGNDEPALRLGVSCFEVKNIEDTKNLIRRLLLQ